MGKEQIFRGLNLDDEGVATFLTKKGNAQRIQDVLTLHLERNAHEPETADINKAIKCLKEIQNPEYSIKPGELPSPVVGDCVATIRTAMGK